MYTFWRNMEKLQFKGYASDYYKLFSYNVCSKCPPSASTHALRHARHWPIAARCFHYSLQYEAFRCPLDACTNQSCQSYGEVLSIHQVSILYLEIPNALHYNSYFGINKYFITILSSSPNAITTLQLTSCVTSVLTGVAHYLKIVRL